MRNRDQDPPTSRRIAQTNSHCSPLESVKDAVGASFCAETRSPGNLELGQFQRSDGVFGTVVPFVGSLDRSLQVPEATVHTLHREKRRFRFMRTDADCPCRLGLPCFIQTIEYL